MTNKGKHYNVGDNNPAKRKEVREKISKSVSGSNHNFYGKKRSKETRLKMSIAATGKKKINFCKDKHPRWIGGSYNYWHAQARKYFFTGYCEICGKTNVEEKNQNGRSLVMHNTLIPKDYTVMNINAWMCTCQSCHMIIENKE